MKQSYVSPCLEIELVGCPKLESVWWCGRIAGGRPGSEWWKWALRIDLLLLLNNGQKSFKGELVICDVTHRQFVVVLLVGGQFVGRMTPVASLGTRDPLSRRGRTVLAGNVFLSYCMLFPFGNLLQVGNDLVLSTFNSGRKFV